MPESLEDTVGHKVPIEYVYPDNLSSNFVSQLVAQFQQDHFILSFFEIWPPLILAETDQGKLAALKAIDRVQAKCVARLVVTPAKMQEFLGVLTENFSRFQSSE
jgi:hypothetical protein